MGMVSSKIEGSKIVSMTMEAPMYKGVKQTLENNNKLKKYSQYLNEFGFITVKVNVKILHDLLVRIYNRLDLQNAPPQMKEFKKQIQSHNALVMSGSL
jgi:archaellum biogenesis protein FlaJ (TadC family)